MLKKIVFSIGLATIPAVVYANFRFRKTPLVQQQIFIDGKPEYLKKAAIEFITQKAPGNVFRGKDTVIFGFNGPEWKVDYGQLMSLDDCLTIMTSETYLGSVPGKLELNKHRIQEMAFLIERMEELFSQEAAGQPAP